MSPFLNVVWEPSIDGRHLYGDALGADVKITIDGNWESSEQRIDFAVGLAERLNDATLHDFERSSAAEAATVLLRALGWEGGGLAAAALEIVKRLGDAERSLSEVTQRAEQWEHQARQQARHAKAQMEYAENLEHELRRLRDVVGDEDAALIDAALAGNGNEIGTAIDHAAYAKHRANDVEFRQWFHDVYVKRGFVSSEAELREAWDAARKCLSLVHADTARLDWLEGQVRQYGDGRTEPRETTLVVDWQQSRNDPEWPGLRPFIDKQMAGTSQGPLSVGACPKCWGPSEPGHNCAAEGNANG